MREAMALSSSDLPEPVINPFDQLVFDCQNSPNKIQARYETHRTNRNAQSREKLLHEKFPGWNIDEILSKLVEQSKAPTGDVFADHRHNLNLYARPPKHIKELVAELQHEIRDVAPTIWFSPLESLHITTLEIASSRTQEEINALAAQLLQDGTALKLVNYPSEHHHARLVKPILSYDASAMALSFLPAADEPTATSGTTDKKQYDDSYTYHNLRRDLAAQVLRSGVGLAARYVVPSAHVTIARFISQDGFLRDGEAIDKERVVALVERIEKINVMLRERYWPGGSEAQDMPVKGEWVVGQEQGLEFNKGTSWYGGGEKVLIGKGFE